MYCDNDSKNTLTSPGVLTKHNMINTIRFIIPPVSGLVSCQQRGVVIFLLRMYFIKPQVISSLVYSDFLMQSISEYLMIQNYCTASLHSLHTLNAANCHQTLFPIEGYFYIFIR